YAQIVHTGVNATGKTVVSPVDGITIVREGDSIRLLMPQHTTCALSKLKGKWIDGDNDGPGDIDKAKAILEDEQKRTPDAKLTIILTTNRVPGEKLYRDTY